MDANLFKLYTFLITNLPSLHKQVKELKNLVGTGSVSFKIENEEGLILRIIINNPTSALEKLAEDIISILPKFNIPGVLVLIDIRRQGETKLLREYHP